MKLPCDLVARLRRQVDAEALDLLERYLWWRGRARAELALARLCHPERRAEHLTHARIAGMLAHDHLAEAVAVLEGP